MRSRAWQPTPTQDAAAVVAAVGAPVVVAVGAAVGAAVIVAVAVVVVVDAAAAAAATAAKVSTSAGSATRWGGRRLPVERAGAVWATVPAPGGAKTLEQQPPRLATRVARITRYHHPLEADLPQSSGFVREVTALPPAPSWSARAGRVGAPAPTRIASEAHTNYAPAWQPRGDGSAARIAGTDRCGAHRLRRRAGLRREEGHGDAHPQGKAAAHGDP